MAVPDFFIIGAPKCGTTALFTYLGQHPGVFLPHNKEPHHFSPDIYTIPLPVRRSIPERSAYEALFEGAPDGALIGEGSTWYLFSEVAVGAILEANPNARFIAMLRNPVVMVQSLFNQNHRNLFDDAPDLEAAWALEPARAEGRDIPVHCPAPGMLRYSRAGRYSWQLRRFFDTVPESQRLVHVYEDFFADPRVGYASTLDFLGLPDDGLDQFERVHGNKTLKNRALFRFLVYPPPPFDRVYPLAKKAANAIGLRPGKALFEWNQKQVERAPVRPEFEAELRRSFAADIDACEEILGRSLDVWKS